MIRAELKSLTVFSSGIRPDVFWTTTGGRALKFYSSVRLDVRKIETLKQGGVMVGNRTRIKVVKNKIAPPFKEAEFDIMFGEGISREGDILDIAANLGIVNKSGAWYAYEGEKIGQGRENAKQLLRDRPQLCEEIEQKVRAHYEALRKEEAEKAAAQAAAKAGRGAAIEPVKTDRTASEVKPEADAKAAEKKADAGTKPLEKKPEADKTDVKEPAEMKPADESAQKDK